MRGTYEEFFANLTKCQSFGVMLIQVVRDFVNQPFAFLPYRVRISFEQFPLQEEKNPQRKMPTNIRVAFLPMKRLINFWQ